MLTQRPQLFKRQLLSFPRTLPEPFASRQLIYTMNGRNAIYHALKAMSIRKGETVLLPAFHCPALVDPVLAAGARVKYYTVRRDLSLDLDEIERMAGNGASALLFVHFFGFPAPVRELTRIARSSSIRLIEDCTHTLTGTIDGRPVGTFGDVAVFSLRKILPVPDGGLLLKNKKGNYLPVFKSPLAYHLRMARWAFEHNENMGTKNSAVQQARSSAKKSDLSSLMRKGPDSHEEPEFREIWKDWSISKISKMVLKRTDLEKVRQKRIKNFAKTMTVLSDIPGIKLFSNELGQLCPLGFPFTSDSPERIDYRLRRLGVPAFSFGEVLHKSLDLQRFPDAKYLSDHLTILPIHQGLSDTDISEMLNIVVQSIKGLHHNSYK